MNGLQSSTSTSSSLGQMFPQAQQSYQSTQCSGVVFVSELSQWQIDTIKKLDQLLDLPRDWDSYGSSPPSEISVKAAVRLILDIDFEYFVSPRIVPVSGGGVQLEWSLGSRDVEIEINDEGSAEYLECSLGKPIEEGPISLVEVSQVRSLLTRLLT